MNTFLSLDINKFMLILLSATMCFYLVKLVPVSPIYIIYLISFLFYLFLILLSKKIIIRQDAAILICLLLFVVVFNIRYLHTSTFINLFFSVISYFIIRSCSNNFGLDFWISTTVLMIKVSLFIIFIDTIYRLLNPSDLTDFIKNNSGSLFYIYKSNSLMFQDSNSTGLVALVLASVYKFLYRNKLYKSRFIWLLTVTIIFLSFSRGAIVSLTLLVFLDFYVTLPKRLRYFSSIILVCTSSIFLYYLLKFVFNDASTLHKFSILNEMYTLVYYSNISSILFGFGLEASIDMLGKHTHILLLTYFFEVGLIGLLLFIVFLTVYAVKIDFLVILPTLISSLSFFTYLGTPFLFVPLALCCNIYLKLKKTPL